MSEEVAPPARRRRAGWRRAAVAHLTALALLVGLFPASPARAEDPPPPAVERTPVVQAWLNGGTKVRAAAELALVGSDDDIRAFVSDGWAKAQRLDERDAVVAVIAESGPAVRGAAQTALNAFDAGDTNALSTFLMSGWRQPSDTDARVRVNQLMAAGGDQVKAAAQQALDSGDPSVLREFVDSGWQSRWLTDQRVRVNQAMAAGGPQVKAAAQKALDAGTPEALESFLDGGWAVAAARDQETETLTALRAEAQAQGDLAKQETDRAVGEAARAKEAAEAAKRSAQLAAAATEAARNDTREAAAQAKRAAVAAQKAASAAKVAVQAAASANRAARAAAAAAQRAASAASQAERAATRAYNAAAGAATDASKADAARVRAQEARDNARLSRDFATTANLAGLAIQAGLDSVVAARSAATNAKLAATANDDATRYANAAGADAKDAIAAAKQARADADRALRAANAAESYLLVAANAAFRARDAANRAAQHAEQAADAAIDAANHAGEAATAAARATAAATAATAAANAAVETAGQAIEIYNAARAADAERLAVWQDEGSEAARQAAAQYGQAQAAAKWDAVQAAQRDAETNQLIAEVLNPGTDPAVAVVKARKVALNLSQASGTWTREAAMTALAGADAQVVEFVRTGIAEAAGQDDRVAVRDLAVTDIPALRDAALAALAGSDAQVSEFLRTQNYTGRYTQDRLKVNQIMSAATKAGDTFLAQKAQEALNSGDGQKLREFIASGQYTAAAVGQRVQVNQIMASADSGPELKAAAQVALDGPPPGLRQFLDEGRYAAAERDQEGAAHLAVVAGLVQRINQIAQTAVQDAMTAQSVAAQARKDAAAAADYANQAAASAQKAAGYATQAAQYANQASQSAEKAAAAVQTAKAAATRASASARSAIRSASWAVTSHEHAVQSAREANASAVRAYDSAIAAGKSADEANAAARDAYQEYESAKGLEIGKCTVEYTAEGPLGEWEKLLTGTKGDYAKNCVRNVIADPAELATRAYTNSAFCGVYPDGSQLAKNCLATVLDPDFRGGQTLTLLTQIIAGITTLLIPVAVALGIGCIATVVCGVVLGTIITIGDVGLNIYKYINGDQGLADTLLHLGTLALETLAFAGIAKLVGAGFKAAKQLYTLSRAAKQAEADLAVANKARRELRLTSCLTRNSFSADTPVLLADGSSKPIADIRVGDRVLATDPTTGESAARPVTDLIRSTDPTLTDVTVTPATGPEATVHTTPHHPFWDVDGRRWVDAADLTVGSTLRNPDGGTVRVSGVRTFDGPQVMHNLTVAETHTYYVAAGSTALLVHNVGGCLDGEKEYVVIDPVTKQIVTDIDSIENGELWELKDGIPWWGDEAWLVAQIDGKFAKYLKSRTILPADYRNAVIGFRFPNKKIDAQTRTVITERLRRLAEDAGVQVKIEFAS
ncbi:polymorphic toxin-type HINT domain-containing protein [Micromonospora sp. NPDC018662]|uniref:polymorphic toxin-type HINT domain-containing protein n=1 Tax=Micromonospora sp. NPDC018662 TaxID=3364238 RepID=UPI00378CD8D1